VRERRGKARVPECALRPQRRARPLLLSLPAASMCLSSAAALRTGVPPDRRGLAPLARHALGGHSTVVGVPSGIARGRPPLARPAGRLSGRSCRGRHSMLRIGSAAASVT